jgi:hypothetical protein
VEFFGHNRFSDSFETLLVPRRNYVISSLDQNIRHGRLKRAEDRLKTSKCAACIYPEHHPTVGQRILACG